MRRAVSSACAAAVALTAPAASADESEQRTWYGWQFLAADLGLLSATALASVHLDEETALALGLGGFVLAGPAIHGAHDRWGLAGLSATARILLPLSCTAIGHEIGGGFDGGGGDDVLGSVAGLLIGFTVGVVAADVIDVADGWEDARVAPTVTTARGTTSVGLTFRY